MHVREQQHRRQHLDAQLHREEGRVLHGLGCQALLAQASEPFLQRAH